MPRDPRSSLVRRGLVVLVVWAALTIGSTLLHHRLWTDWRLAPPPLRLDHPALILANNMLHALTAPTWLGMRLATGFWPTFTVPGTALTFGVSYAGLLATGAVALVIRRRLIEPRPAVGRVAASTPSAGSNNPDSPGPDLARRRFVVDAAGLAALSTAGGLVAYSTLREPTTLRVRRYTLPIRDLDPSLVGLRMVQISDTHLGPRVPHTTVRHAVERALSLDPDVVALTGDYIHDGQQFIPAAAELFRPLVATGKPVVAVLGNHDWYGFGPRVAAALRGVGITMLDNSHVYLDPGSRGVRRDPSEGVLALAGFGDLLTHEIHVDRALGSIPDHVPRVVLSHNPDVAELMHAAAPFWKTPKYRGSLARIIDASKGTRRIDAMLSGHTHGGQIAVPGFGPLLVPSRFGRKYAGGICQGPASPVVVSRGVGMSILPVRLNVPPEISLITLVPG